MNRSPKAQVSRLVPPRAAQILGECHRLAKERLPTLLKLVLDKVDDAFFDLANKADSSQRQQIFFDAMRELRLKRTELEAAFYASLRADYESSFSALSAGTQRPGPAGAGGLELSLVAPDDVEEALAITNFAESIKVRCKADLFALDRRVGHLLSDPDLSAGRNPFGPEVIGSALRAMCGGLNANIEVKLTLLKFCDKHAGPGLHELYQVLNDHLMREGVLPKLATTFARPGGRSPTTRVIIETDGQTAEAAGADVFSTLQKLMHSGAGLPGGPGAAFAPGGGAYASGTAHGAQAGFPSGTGSGPGGGAAGPLPQAGGVGGQGAGQGGGVPITTTALVSALTQLQHGDLAGIPATAVGLEPGALQSGAGNVLRTLRETGAVGDLNQTDNLTLDIVSMLFDYILDDPAIPNSIKALIGRLQIPMLKVALMDKELFSKKTHPARRLLDGLAEAAIGWSDDSLANDALFEKMQYIVYRVVEEFDCDLALFSTLLEELNSFLTEDERATRQRAERSARSLQSKERIVLAKMAADDAVKSRLEGSEMREFVRQFVLDHWRQLLIVTHVECGPDSAAWQSQLDVIDELAWSVRTKTTPDDRKALTNRLPKLIKALRAGMKDLDMEPAVCSRFLTMLASVHVVSVKQVEEASLAERKYTTAQPVVAEPVAQDQDETEFVKQALDRLFARKVIDTTELDIDLSAFAPEREPEVEDSELIEDEYLEKVMELDLGDWLEFTHADGSRMRARFTWISPATGRYLFTDRQGQKAFDLTMHRLVDQFRTGSAIRIAAQPDPLFERAIGELMDRLEHQAVA